MYIEKKRINYILFLKKEWKYMILFKISIRDILKNIQHNEFLQCKLALNEQGSGKSIFVKLVLFQGFFHFITYWTNKRRTNKYFSKFNHVFDKSGQVIGTKIKKTTATVSLHFQMILSKIPLQCNYVFIFRLTDIWHSAWI